MKSPVKEAKNYLHFLNKKWNYSREQFSEKDLQKISELREDLARVVSKDIQGDAAVDVIKRADAFCGKKFPAKPADWWIENVEVIFVALVLALGLRTYVIQPFKIPTGSMEPTLMGIHAVPLESSPNPIMQVLNFVFQGKRMVSLVARDQEQVQMITEQPYLGVFTTVVVRTDKNTYRLWAGGGEIRRGAPQLFDGSRDRPAQILSDRVFEPGETILRFARVSGDHVFVNKMSYHFRKPRQGEVFVFTTAGIQGIHGPHSPMRLTQYYIKRCVGVPESELRLDPPMLTDRREPIEHPIMQRIMRMENGYEGYATGTQRLRHPEDWVRLRKKEYWAMGDNSYNSEDSRSWGVVPERNLIGSGLVVYWPFSRRWGLIH